MKSIGIHHYGYVFLESSQGSANHICKASIHSVPETHLALSEDLVNKWTNLEGLLLKDRKYYLKKKSYECKKSALLLKLHFWVCCFTFNCFLCYMYFKDKKKEFIKHAKQSCMKWKNAEVPLVEGGGKWWYFQCYSLSNKAKEI